MATITEASFLSAVQTINEYLSNYVLVFLLLGVGIWYTIKTKFVQIRCSRRAGTASSATSPSTARRAAAA